MRFHQHQEVHAEFKKIGELLNEAINELPFKRGSPVEQRLDVFSALKLFQCFFKSRRWRSTKDSSGDFALVPRNIGNRVAPD